MFNANFGQLYCRIKIKLFDQFCCSFYGSPLWYLNGAAVQSLCIDWSKSLRSLWGVYPTTHCNVITALSNQIPLISFLQNRYIRFMPKCLSSSNCILKLISHFAIANRMSAEGRNYRSLIDDDRGAKVGGLGGSQPPLNFGRGVEPPLIFRKICVEILKIGPFCVKFLKVGLF